MKKTSLFSLRVFPLIIALVLTVAPHVAVAQPSTSVLGIIKSDSVWTKANSSYLLEGPVAVDKGVTLTIEPGVTINLNGYYIQVNGTLIARGTDSEQIRFEVGSIIFKSVSSEWNEQTGSGSILENTVADSLSTDASVKLTKSIFSELNLDGGSSTVSHNTIGKLGIGRGALSPTIVNNEITGDFTIYGGSPTIKANTIKGRPWARSGSPVFSSNKIFNGIHADSSGDSVTITNNEISSSGDYGIIFVAGIHADISNNKLIGYNRNPMGICVSGVLSSASITQNQIYGCKIGISVGQCNVQIYRNAVFDNDIGMNLVFNAPMQYATGPWGENKTVDVQENTIANNAIGIQYTPYLLTSITKNNIQDNSQCNFKLQNSENISIPNNWWGTTDSQTISQKIYDNKKDFNLGIVSFSPVSTAPNSNTPATDYDPTTAPPATKPAPPPSPSPPSNPEPEPPQSPDTTPPGSPDQSDSQVTPQTWVYEAAIVILILVVGILTVTIGVILRKRR